MTEKKLQDIAAQYYNKLSLSEDQMQLLQGMQDDAVARQTGSGVRAWLSGFSVAAALLFSVGLYLFNPQPVDIINDIAYEVTQNHLKLKPMEITTSTMAGVSAYFTELEFSPVKSDYFATGAQKLLGGRYCSIQDSIAAQLRYEMDDGSLMTLFETNYNIDQFSDLPDINKGMKPKEVHARGLLVKIWVEKGLVMASVEEP
jgi:hypothetical protein